VERVTITLDKRTLAAIRRLAGPRGMSRFVAIAAKERLAQLGRVRARPERTGKRSVAPVRRSAPKSRFKGGAR
jgi:hypothetical protein